MKALPFQKCGPHPGHPGAAAEKEIALELRDGNSPMEAKQGRETTLWVGQSAIVEGLEERFRRLSFLPEDPRDRAFVRHTLEMVRPVMRLPRWPSTRSKDKAKSAEDDAEYLQAIEGVTSALEAELSARDVHGAFAVGHSATLTDLWLVVLGRALRSRGASLMRFPEVQRVFSSMGQIGAVEQAYSYKRGGLFDELRPAERDRYIRRFHEVLEPISGQMRLLEAIGWSRETEERFFAQGADRLPEVEYRVDRDGYDKTIAALSGLLKELDADHVFVEWLRAIVHSFIDGYRMLSAVGTRSFYSLSLELYGGAKTTAFDRNTTNLDLAAHVERRLGEEHRFVESNALDTAAFIAFLERKLAEQPKKLDLRIVVDENLSSKVICGRTRLRVRAGASFGFAEAEGLWLHEVETHALTAQNGAAQKLFPLLKAGGPRATRTQEGLAVFAELYGHSMSSPRLMRIASRVRLVGDAEDGASFLDLYRGLIERGVPPRDAYQDAARVCRGGLIQGGAPFTKDACYLAGLVDVYALLRQALRFRSPLLGEILVSGRIHRMDLLPLLWLREQGILSPPSYLPSWVERWDTVLSYFAFTSFLNEIDTSQSSGLSDDAVRFVEKAVARYDEDRRAAGENSRP